MTMEPIAVGIGYRELGPWEPVETKGKAEGVLEALWAGSWRVLSRIRKEECAPAAWHMLQLDIPHPYSVWKEKGWTIRTSAPGTYPPMSRETLGSMEKDARAVVELASEVPQGHRDGYTVAEVRESMSPSDRAQLCETASRVSGQLDAMDQFHKDALEHAIAVSKDPTVIGPAEKEIRRIFGFTDDARTEDSDVLQIARALDVRHAENLREIEDMLYNGPEGHKRTATTSQDSDDAEEFIPTYNAAMTHVTIPVTHPWHPKPFTPNKYTRDMPTLDGRTVPVDVYCVLAAFPTGSAAVDHAVKKELAPGQRGVKTRLQDLKEARASLDRAIQLEEAVQG